MTFVESVDWSNVVVSVATCSTRPIVTVSEATLHHEDLPLGQVGLCNAQVCLISFPGVSEMYLPRTPPPNSSNSEPGVAVLYNVPSIFSTIRRHPEVTLADARDHIGIRFSSVRRENRSSPDARNVASTSTMDTLIF